MAFKLPRNVPYFDDSQRQLEDVYFAQTQRGGKDLPMYKDKPYNWSEPGKPGPIWRKKRVLVVFIIFILGILFLQNSERSTKKGRSKWAWKSKSGIDWEGRAEEVKTAFDMSWNRYVKYAFGKDRFAPISKESKRIGDAGMGLFTVGVLDTLMLMNKTQELSKARDWVATFLTGDQNVEVEVFEIGSKVIGGLLAANYLVTEGPNRGSEDEDEHSGLGEDLYLEKATDLADRILGGFESPTKIPYQHVNLDTRRGSGKTVATGNAGGNQLELRDLAKNNGEKFFWNAAEGVSESLASFSHLGLIPPILAPASRKFEISDPIVSSSSIGYYESLLKQYLQTSKQEPVYLELWKESIGTIMKSHVAYTRHANTPVISVGPYKPEFDSVRMAEASCSLPGLIALSLTSGRTLSSAKQSKSWTKDKDTQFKFAKQLMQTCWIMHKSQPTGLAPFEVSVLVQDSPSTEVQKGASMKGVMKAVSGAEGNYQAPASIESLYYLYAITGDETYRKWGWELFEAYRNHTLGPAGEGFYSLEDVTTVPPKSADGLNDLWFSKTLKFFYLLFSDNHGVELEKVVFNSAGHILPRWKLQRGLKTGWKRRGAAKATSEVEDTEEAQ